MTLQQKLGGESKDECDAEYHHLALLRSLNVLLPSFHGR